MPPTGSINELSFPTIAHAVVKPKPEGERFYGAVVKRWRVGPFRTCSILSSVASAK
jgi:hypothetical protein